MRLVVRVRPPRDRMGTGPCESACRISSSVPGIGAPTPSNIRPSIKRARRQHPASRDQDHWLPMPEVFMSGMFGLKLDLSRRLANFICRSLALYAPKPSYPFCPQFQRYPMFSFEIMKSREPAAPAFSIASQPEATSNYPPYRKQDLL